MKQDLLDILNKGINTALNDEDLGNNKHAKNFKTIAQNITCSERGKTPNRLKKALKDYLGSNVFYNAIGKGAIAGLSELFTKNKENDISKFIKKAIDGDK
jgi:hypothetical protein